MQYWITGGDHLRISPVSKMVLVPGHAEREWLKAPKCAESLIAANSMTVQAMIWPPFSQNLKTLDMCIFRENAW